MSKKSYHTQYLNAYEAYQKNDLIGAENMIHLSLSKKIYPDAYFLLGMIRMRQGNLLESNEFFNRYLSKFSPESNSCHTPTHAHFHMGMNHKQMNNYFEAINDFDFVISHGDLLKDLSFISNANSQRQSCYSTRASLDYSALIFEQNLLANPQEKTPLLHLSIIKGSQRKFLESISLLVKYLTHLQNCPNLTPAQVIPQEVILQNSFLRYQSFLKTTPDGLDQNQKDQIQFHFMSAFKEFALLCFRVHKSDLSVNSFNQFLYLYSEKNSQDQVISEINRLSNLFRNFSLYNQAYDFSMSALGKLDDGSSKENVIYTFLNLAKVKYDLGNTSESIQAFKKLTQIDPEFQLPYLELGSIYLQTKDFENSFAYFLKYLEAIRENESFPNLREHFKHNMIVLFKELKETTLSSALEKQNYNIIKHCIDLEIDFTQSEKTILANCKPLLDNTDIGQKSHHLESLILEKNNEKEPAIENSLYSESRAARSTHSNPRAEQLKARTSHPKKKASEEIDTNKHLL